MLNPSQQNRKKQEKQIKLGLGELQLAAKDLPLE
jgi:hypothetical protein